MVFGVLESPFDVWVTRSIVPLTGDHTKPNIPLPSPRAPPCRPPSYAPIIGSATTPATAENILLSMLFVPRANPSAIFDGSSSFCFLD